MYCFFFLSSICTLKLTWSLPQRTKVILKIDKARLQRVSWARSHDLFLSPPVPLSSTTWLHGVWLCCCVLKEWPCSTTHPSQSKALCCCFTYSVRLLPAFAVVVRRWTTWISLVRRCLFSLKKAVEAFERFFSYTGRYNCLNNLASKRKTVCNQILISSLCYGAVVSRAFSTPSLTTSPHTHRCCSSS